MTFLDEMTPIYKGDFYYARGPLKDPRLNMDKNELWGKIMVKNNGEWIDTCFRVKSEWIIWEDK